MSLLAGQQPPATGGPSPTWPALWALVGLIVLQTVGIARSVVLLRRWKTNPATRPHAKMTVILHVILPISVSFVWALVCLVAVPALVGYPLRLLWLIDFGQVIIITGPLALTWGIVKAILAYLPLHRGPRRLAAEPASDAGVIADGVASTGARPGRPPKVV